MNHNRNIQFLSSGGLFIAALLWGVSYPATKLVEDYPTFFILPARFLIASAILAVLFRKHFRKMNREILKHAALLSLFVTSMYVFSTVGIKYTISARASFFTCLTFVIVPVLNRLLFRVKISGVILRSIILCFAGVLLLSYAPGMAGLALNYGDLLCIVASVAGSLHIVFLGRVSKKETFDPMLFTTLLMAFVTVWTALAALFTGSFQGIEITGFDWALSPFWASSAAQPLFCFSPSARNTCPPTEPVSSSPWSRPPAASCRFCFSTNPWELPAGSALCWC